ncbi:hypothetical protein J6590_032843 [Homalodisca vitripennis]|nr:hypothetical protein J6590_032843 [Homalodisca vitripennis]
MTISWHKFTVHLRRLWRQVAGHGPSRHVCRTNSVLFIRKLFYYNYRRRSDKEGVSIGMYWVRPDMSWGSVLGFMDRHTHSYIYNYLLVFYSQIPDTLSSTKVICSTSS